MNTDAQRIALAQACGWNHVHYARDLSESTGTDCFRGQPPGKRNYYDNVPDYLHDLNAMHGATETLEASQKTAFVDALIAIAPRHSMAGLQDFALINATAAQRAEAFLRTIGKWTEDAT